MALTCADYEGTLHSVGGEQGGGGGSCMCHGGGAFALEDIAFVFPETGCFYEEPLLDGQMAIFQLAVALESAEDCPDGTFFHVALTYEIGCNEEG